MVVPGFSLPDAQIHKPAQGIQNVNRREHALAVQLPAKGNLAFSDISCKVWDWVSDVIAWHCEYWELRYAALLAFYHACPLVEHGKVSVHIARVAAPPRNLRARSAYLPQAFGVIRHVSQYDQHVHFLPEGEVFSCRKGHSWRNKPFNSGVVCKVEENDSPFQRPSLLKLGDEFLRLLACDSHCREHYGESAFAAADLCLPCYLHGDFVMGKARGREYWQLLSPDEGVRAINCRDASLDKVRRVCTCIRVYGSPSYVNFFFWNYFGPAIYRLSGAIQDSAKEII